MSRSEMGGGDEKTIGAKVFEFEQGKERATQQLRQTIETLSEGVPFTSLANFAEFLTNERGAIPLRRNDTSHGILRPLSGEGSSEWSIAVNISLNEKETRVTLTGVADIDYNLKLDTLQTDTETFIVTVDKV